MTARLAALSDRILPIWFLVWTLVRIQQLGWTGTSWDLSFVGRDFWIYRNAAVNLLAGADPWAASAHWNGTDWHFAAPPTAAQLFVPFAWLDASVGLVLFVGLSMAAIALALRGRGMPLWWLLFPPLTEGLIAANPQIVLLGLLLIGSGAARRTEPATAIGVARAIATGLKVYAILPIVARREWRAVGIVIVVLVLSIIAAPSVWQSYLSRFGAISARVIQESNGGLSASIFLKPSIFGTALPPDELLRQGVGLSFYGLIAALVLLAAIRDVPSAGWLAAPLLWPAAEYHLATMVIPVARRLSVWVIAVPTLPTYLFGLILLAYEIVAARDALPRTGRPVGLRSWLTGLRRGAPADPPESAPDA
jgi:hypothetical protein